MDMNFWQWLIAIVVGAIAITFNLNKYLEWRRERREESLKALCPHTIVRPLESGQFLVESLFNSPPGTLSWHCNQCGLVVLDENLPQKFVSQWSANPVGWIEADKRFQKAYEKFHGI